MQRVGQRLHGLIGGPDLPAKELLAPGPEIFLKIQRIEGDGLHLTHGEGVFLAVDGHAQQAACGGDVKFWRLLAEVFQCRQGPLAGLDLVEDDQRFTGDNTLAGGCLQIPQKALRLDILIEVGGHRQIGLQIDVDDIFELLLSEPAEDVGLSHLSGAVDDQRQAVGCFLFPGKQLFLDLTLHVDHLTSTAYLLLVVKSRKICRFNIFLDLKMFDHFYPGIHPDRKTVLRFSKSYIIAARWMQRPPARQVQYRSSISAFSSNVISARMRSPSSAGNSALNS